jgi:hypothetical protein
MIDDNRHSGHGLVIDWYPVDSTRPLTPGIASMESGVDGRGPVYVGYLYFVYEADCLEYSNRSKTFVYTNPPFVFLVPWVIEVSNNVWESSSCGRICYEVKRPLHLFECGFLELVLPCRPV